MTMLTGYTMKTGWAAGIVVTALAGMVACADGSDPGEVAGVTGGSDDVGSGDATVPGADATPDVEPDMDMGEPPDGPDATVDVEVPDEVEPDSGADGSAADTDAETAADVPDGDGDADETDAGDLTDEELADAVPDVDPSGGLLTPPESWTACDPAIGVELLGCVEELLTEPELRYGTNGWIDAAEACSDAEPVAGARDRTCADGRTVGRWCDADIEELALELMPACRVELRNVAYNASCALGARWPDVFTNDGMRVLAQRVVTSESTLSALDEAQLVESLVRSGRDEVTSIADVWSVVDGGEVNRVSLWDVTARRALVAWEYGLGDNSYGAVFAADKSELLVRIGDGDFYECQATWGAEARRCLSEADCRDGLSCLGVVDGFFEGRCVDVEADGSLPGADAACADVSGGCGEDTGLLCADSSGTDAEDGLCLPAWMRRTVRNEYYQELGEGDGGETTFSLVMTGSATVSTDVWLGFAIGHADISQLRVTLENPSGTRSVVYSGDSTGTDLWFEGRVGGFPGDESSNGVWTLIVEDVVEDGAVGFLSWVELTVGSRFD
jgi:hypothetical protein